MTTNTPTPALDVDALAQEIRRIDGSHSLGAGAIAEALMPFITALQANAAAVEPLTDSYLQIVPDKCDRIVWRNHYYHLPIVPARAQEVPVALSTLTGRWIDVEAARPEPEVFVLCWDGRKTFVEWFGSKHPREFGVTHWMPYQIPPGATSDMHDGQRSFAASAPAPQTVQEIMRLMSPYISACVDAGVNNVTGRTSLQFEADVAKVETAFKPLEAALTTLVEKNHELQFSLDGVNAMRKTWNALTDEDRTRAFNSMPDMLNGFLKTWGWLHFAKAIESICREKNFHGIEPQQGESHE